MPLRGGGRTKNIGGPLLHTRFSITASVLFYIWNFWKNRCNEIRIWREPPVFAKSGRGMAPRHSPFLRLCSYSGKNALRLKRAWRALTSYRLNHNPVTPLPSWALKAVSVSKLSQIGFVNCVKTSTLVGLVLIEINIFRKFMQKFHSLDYYFSTALSA